MKLLDSLLHSQRWDFIKRNDISYTTFSSAQMIPGRREEQLETKHNKIYNKYNIAELQVSQDTTIKYIHRRQMNCGQCKKIFHCRALFATSTGGV